MGASRSGRRASACTWGSELVEELLHYQILEKIGQGGMGEVYAARDTRLDRKVALKLLPREVGADPQRRARFQQEAKLLAALNHPHIVTIFSVEQSGDSLFLTMELIEGKTLGELIPKEGLPLARFFELAIPIADALAAAHRDGITHRDLKPANVMVTEDGRVKVLDFGLAKLVEADRSADIHMTQLETETMTEQGTIVGTVAYMSPEQAEGKPVDARSDIFSLGIVLYEMATGRCPFQGDTPISTITSILRDTPPSITELKGSLPRHLGRIVTHCLAKDLERRYQTAADLRNDLQGLREEIDSGELSVAAETVLPGAPPRSALLAVGLLALVVAAIALGYGAWRSFVDIQGDPGSGGVFQSMKMTRLTATGKSSRAAISADGKYIASILQESGKYSLWVSQVSTAGSVRVVPPHEGVLSGPTFSPDGNLIYYLSASRESIFAEALYSVPLLGGTPRKVLDGVSSEISFSPDGKQFAFVRIQPQPRESSLMVANVDGGEVRFLAKRIPPDDYVSGPAWSPDGRVIAISADTYPAFHLAATAVEVPAGGGAERPITPRRWRWIGEVKWLPDGSGLILAAAERTGKSQLWKVSYPGGQVQRITNDLNSYWEVSLTGDGESLVTTIVEPNYNLWVTPLGTGAPSERLTSGSKRDDGRGISWTPDGRIVWGSAFEDSVHLWITDPGGSGARRLTHDERYVHTEPCVSPDGRYVVFQSNRAGDRYNLWRLDLQGGDLVQLTSGKSEFGAQCHPGGKWVVYTGSLPTGQHALFRIPLLGGEPEMLNDKYDLFVTPAISPDGKKLAIVVLGQERPGVEVIPIEGEGVLQKLEFRVIDSPIVRWAPDGKSLTYVASHEGAANIWSQPLDGGPPRQLTHFETDSIDSFAWSPDGAQIALALGGLTRDVVLLENFH